MNNLTERVYLLYQCAPSTELRGRRKEHDRGCFLWAVRSTKKPPTGKCEMQAAPCKRCKNRPRIAPAQITTFYDRISAQGEMDRRNGVEE